jgi:hypothetical protein
MNPRVRDWLAALICLALTATSAQGQTPALTQPIDSGSLIRFRLINGEAGRGRMLMSFYPGQRHLTFCHYPRTPCASVNEPASRRVSLAAISKLEVARGTRAGRGALIGSLAGVVLTNLSARLANGFCERQCADESAITLAGALGGALWGAALGSTVHVWRPVR